MSLKAASNLLSDSEKGHYRLMGAKTSPLPLQKVSSKQLRSVRLHTDMPSTAEHDYLYQQKVKKPVSDEGPP